MAKTTSTANKKIKKKVKRRSTAGSALVAQETGSSVSRYLVKGDLVSEKVNGVDKLYMQIGGADGPKVDLEALANVGAEHLTLRVKLSAGAIIRTENDKLGDTIAALRNFLNARAEYIVSSEVTCCNPEN